MGELRKIRSKHVTYHFSSIGPLFFSAHQMHGGGGVKSKLSPNFTEQ